jgi:hypothetical protein
MRRMFTIAAAATLAAASAVAVSGPASAASRQLVVVVNDSPQEISLSQDHLPAGRDWSAPVCSAQATFWYFSAARPQIGQAWSG